MMQMDYTLFDATTGLIIQTGWGEPPEREGTGWIAGRADDATQFVGMDGALRVLPPRPGPWAAFDRASGEWTDPRTPEDLAAALAQARAGASLSKIDFIMGCMSLGLLTPPEAIAAARGEIPQSFAPVVESLSPMQRDYACVHWGAARLIERMDPFIGAVAQAASVSDETLDLLFGVEVPA